MNRVIALRFPYPQRAVATIYFMDLCLYVCVVYFGVELNLISFVNQLSESIIKCARGTVFLYGFGDFQFELLDETLLKSTVFEIYFIALHLERR